MYKKSSILPKIMTGFSAYVVSLALQTSSIRVDSRQMLVWRYS